MAYDATQHSKDRLGMAAQIPAVPMMPTEAQVSCATGMVHLRLMGTAYVRAGLPSIHPASFQATVSAIKAQPMEPSWSGSPSPYYTLAVEPSPDGCSCLLKAGEVTIGRVAVFPDVDIVSPDQIHEAMQQSDTAPKLDPPADVPPPGEPAEPPTEPAS